MKIFHVCDYYLAEFFLEWEMFQIEIVEKIEIHIFCSIKFFSRKPYRLWDNVEKSGGAREAANDNMVSHWMLD
jgi:hypothetical protein